MEADEVMAAYAAAWQRGEPEAAFALLGDDVVLRLPGRGALAGAHVGREAVVGVIRALLARTDDGSTVEVDVIDRLTSDGGRVALVVREAVVRGDDRLELRRVNCYRVADGRIREIDIFEADQYEVDEFFG